MTWLFFSIVIAIIAALVANLLVPITMPRDTSGGNIAKILQSPEFRELLRRRFSIQMNIQGDLDSSGLEEEGHSNL